MGQPVAEEVEDASDSGVKDVRPLLLVSVESPVEVSTVKLTRM